MELYNALIELGISTSKDLNSLIIKAQISDGMRNENAFSARFFVSDANGNKLCSVKKIPRTGMFNLNSILHTQNLFRNLRRLSTPKISGVYEGLDGYIYIIEEYLNNCISLYDAMEQGIINSQEAIKIVNSVFESIMEQSSEPFDQKVLNEDLKIFEVALGLLDLPENKFNEIKYKFDCLIDDSLNSIITDLTWTSRDILTRNIMIGDMKVYLTDFDLSRKTHLFWIDMFRCGHYSNIAVQDLIVKNDVNPDLMELLFHLTEITLQYNVLKTKAFSESFKPHKQKVLHLLNAFGFELEGSLDTISKHEGVFSIDDPFLQLFWSFDGTFLEEYSEKINILENGDFNRYTFEVPNDIKLLRLDPSNKQGLITFSYISIISNGTNLIKIDKENDYKELSVNNGLIQLERSEFFQIASLNDDPQLIIDIQELMTEECHDNYLNIIIEMMYTPEIYNAISESMKNKENDALTLRNQLQDSRTEFLQLDKEYREVKDNFIIATKKLEDSALWLKTLENDLTHGKNQINSLQKELERLKINESYQYNELSLLKNEINTIKNTLSWKITAPLRKLGKLRIYFNKGLDLLSIITNKKFIMNMIAINDLVKGMEHDQWTSTGQDPYFLLQGKFPKGWIKIKWTSSSEINLPLKLYWDEGNGFSEGSSHIFGHIKKGEKIVQDSIIFVSPFSKKLRLDTGETQSEFMLQPLEIYKITRVHVLIKSAYNFINQRGMTLKTINSLLKKTWAVFRVQGFKGVWEKIKQSLVGGNNLNNRIDYQTWLIPHLLTASKQEDILREIETFTYKPKISVIVPVYNVDEVWLVKCIESVRNQLYTNWELCIADDASPKLHIKEILKKYEALDERIKVVYREINGHISEASNSALNIANGEFIALLDHDDELTIDALFENIKLLNDHKDADMIYSDEDKISMEGERHSPFFKPDWSPDTFLSHMYVCHLGVYRTSLVKKIGGFRKGYEGAQDYDLALRITELTSKIFHIPKVLYHWRTIPESTASTGAAKDYTKDAGFKALQDVIVRRGIDGWVERSEIPNVYTIHYRPTGNPKISILIPTRNMGDILDQCLSSIYDKTKYQNYEVIVIDNGSDDKKTLDIFNKWGKIERNRFKVLPLNIPFNYSKINNEAAKIADGDLLLLLNNDIEVISPNWLEEMAGQAIRSSIGAVGANLLYPDNTIQHGGVILGIGGVADHSHKHSDINSPGYFSKLKTVNNYSAVTAACLMVRKEVFFEVGGLDELLEVAFNDIDFCLRIREQGYNIVWLPHVMLYHHESKSRGLEDTPIKLERFYREVAFMNDRWGDKLFNDPYYNPNLSLEHRDFRLKPINYSRH